MYAESAEEGSDALRAVQATRGAAGTAVHAESVSCRAPVVRVKGRGTLLQCVDRNDVPVFTVGAAGPLSPTGDAVVTVRVEVDFGHPAGGEDGTAETWVPWPAVTAGSRPACRPAPAGTADHDPGDAAVEGLSAYVSDVQAGAGFTVAATAPGGTWGLYLVDVAG